MKTQATPQAWSAMEKRKEKEIYYIKLEAKDHDLPCNHGENIYPLLPVFTQFCKIFGEVNNLLCTY